MMSSGLLEMLLFFATLTLAGLTLVGGIGGVGLLTAKWGRWRLLLSTLAPLAVAIGFTAVVVVALVESTRRGGGIPDAIEIAIVAAAVTTACLFLSCGVVALAALIENRRWGVIATLAAAPIVLFVLIAGGLFLTYQRQTSEPVAVSAELGPAARITKPLPGEFAEVAVASEVASPEDSADGAAGGEERPAWVDGGRVIPSTMSVHSAGPSVLLEDAERDARHSLELWVWEEIAGNWSDAGRQPPEEWHLGSERDPVIDRFTETRETSVGTVHFVHLLGEITPEDREYWERRFSTWYGASQTTQNFRNIALGGAGVLALLGVAHLALRRGATPSEPPNGEP